ncbi:MAG: hypothetical protein KTR28_05800 [Micavibrio sp.]|nr:hypothetical protein [Micavibrio sp.]
MANAVDAVENAGKSAFHSVSKLAQYPFKKPLMFSGLVAMFAVAAAASGGTSVAAAVGEVAKDAVITGASTAWTGGAYLAQQGLTYAPDVISAGAGWVGNLADTVYYPATDVVTGNGLEDIGPKV